MWWIIVKLENIIKGTLIIQKFNGDLTCQKYLRNKDSQDMLQDVPKGF
jgi:hypothetical protein